MTVAILELSKWPGLLPGLRNHQGKWESCRRFNKAVMMTGDVWIRHLYVITCYHMNRSFQSRRMACWLLKRWQSTVLKRLKNVLQLRPCRKNKSFRPSSAMQSSLISLALSWTYAVIAGMSKTMFFFLHQAKVLTQHLIVNLSTQRQR